MPLTKLVALACLPVLEPLTPTSHMGKSITIVRAVLFILSRFIHANRLGSSLVDATIDVFNTITKELLPTPQKSHYTFNLRDLAKVFQGKQANRACLDWVYYHCCSAQ